MSYPDAYIVEICMGGTSGAQVGLAQVGLEPTTLRLTAGTVNGIA